MYRNLDVKARDFILFGEYDESKYTGGTRHFVVPIEKIKQLIKLGIVDMDERQQDYSPSVQEFLEEVDDFTLIQVKFEGYVVSSSRKDCRLTLDGIQIEIPKRFENTMTHFVSTYRGADEFSLSFDDENWYIRAWWD